MKINQCTKCAMISTRPRLTFNEEGICSACSWVKEKNDSVNWEERYGELIKLCKEIKKEEGFDCIVPVSGGKDSTYVADKMKNQLGLNILTITINPDLQFDICKENLQNFLQRGFDHIGITPNKKVISEINKRGFIEQGRPLIGWQMAVQAAVVKLAVALNIPLVMFGEEGESEYGGTSRLKNNIYYNVEDTIEIYLEGNSAEKYLDSFTRKELEFMEFPNESEILSSNLHIAHWSTFEKWDSYEHYLLAEREYGFRTRDSRSIGTYSNYGQLDTMLYDLHVYMMFLKFGFGRCSQDVCIDIRANRTTRDKGLELIKMYDGEYPEEYEPYYLDYFHMTKEEFQNVIDSWANKELLTKVKGQWRLKEDIIK